MVKRFGFGKQEKLKSRKQIDDLFLKGKSFGVSPLRVVYRFVPTNQEGTLQVGVTAGKKYFKRAVDRNRIKRLLREAYRLQKNELLDAVKKKNLTGHLFFTYTDKNIADFLTIKKAMNTCLQRLEINLPLHENLS